MKALTDLCRFARLLPSLEQQGRRMVTTISAQDAANEQERRHGPANPHSVNLNPTFPATYPPNRVSVGDGDMANGSVEADGTNSGLNAAHEKHVDYGPTAGFRNPTLDKDEPHATVSGQRAEAESVVTPDQKYGIPPDNGKKSEYNIQKACLHANLWRREIKKHLGEGTSIEADADSEFRLQESDYYEDGSSYAGASLVSSSEGVTMVVGNIPDPPHHATESSGWNPRKSMPEDWEILNPSEGHYYDESAAKEEAMMFEEFEKRRERNRIQIASFVKQHLYGRRRPVDGWKYILNNFGKDGKGARGSALSVEGQTAGNDLEKLALKRESGRLRRKA